MLASLAARRSPQIVPIVDVPKSEFVLSQCDVTEYNAAGVKPGDHSFESTSDPRLWRIKIKGEHYTTYLKPIKQEVRMVNAHKQHNAPFLKLAALIPPHR